MDRPIISRMSKALHIIFCVSSGAIVALCFIVFILVISLSWLSVGLVITVGLFLGFGVRRGVWRFPPFRLSRGQILLVLLTTAVGLIIGLFFIPENCQVIDRPPGVALISLGTCERGFPVFISSDSVPPVSNLAFSSPSELYAYMQQNPEEVQHSYLLPPQWIWWACIIDLFFYAGASIILVFLLSGMSPSSYDAKSSMKADIP